MLFEEGIIYIRAMLNDFETSDPETGEIIPPEYTDEGLGLLLAIGIKQVQLALNVPKECRIDVSMTPPYVDPFVDICDEFIELVILNTLCRLQKRNIDLQFGLDSVSTTIGPVSLKIAQAQWGKMPKFIWESTSPCVEYDKKMTALAAFDIRRTRAIYAIRANVSGKQPPQGFDPRSQMIGGTSIDEQMIQ